MLSSDELNEQLISGWAMTSVSEDKVDEYQGLMLALEEVFGVVVGDEKRSLMINKFHSVMANSGIDSLPELASRIRGEQSHQLRAEVLQAITSNDVGWFSYPEITRLLHDYLLPNAIDNNKNDYRIWVVGCGFGQLAYSLAMSIDAFKQDHNVSNDFEVVATDISEDVVNQAAKGRYDEGMLDGLSVHYKKKYMVAEDDHWNIGPVIKPMVRFAVCDLLEMIDSMGRFDLVICPDVFIYFSTSVKKKILEEMSYLLDPSGILVVGANEPVAPFTDRFEHVNHEAGVFYRQLSK